MIDAAGAWAGRLGRAAGQRLPIESFRRHLFVTGRPRQWPRDAPFIWTRGADEVYARPEGGGLLVSPCDEQRREPCEPRMSGERGASDASAAPPPVDPAMREQLAERLLRHAPGLADLAIRRGWACLRSFAPDHRPLIGADATLPGLYHLSGFGGSGVTTSGALGALAAASLLGRTLSWIDLRLFAADRVIPPSPVRSHMPSHPAGTPPHAEDSAPVAKNPAPPLARTPAES